MVMGETPLNQEDGVGQSLSMTVCTLHTAHCKLHNAHCTLQTANCTMNTAHCKLNTAHCTYLLTKTLPPKYLSPAIPKRPVLETKTFTHCASNLNFFFFFFSFLFFFSEASPYSFCHTMGAWVDTFTALLRPGTEIPRV